MLGVNVNHRVQLRTSLTMFVNFLKICLGQFNAGKGSHTEFCLQACSIVESFGAMLKGVEK
jgi:hypothetical protein